MMVFSPGIIGQVAWFILIDKRRCRAAICAASYEVPPDSVFMLSSLSATPSVLSIPSSDHWPSCISHGVVGGIVQDAGRLT